MKCVICKHGETCNGTVTLAFDRNEITVVFRSVPALVCDNCGEEYVDDTTAARVLKAFEHAVEEGVLLGVRQDTAA